MFRHLCNRRGQRLDGTYSNCDPEVGRIEADFEDRRDACWKRRLLPSVYGEAVIAPKLTVITEGFYDTALNEANDV